MLSGLILTNTVCLVSIEAQALLRDLGCASRRAFACCKSVPRSTHARPAVPLCHLRFSASHSVLYSVHSQSSARPLWHQASCQLSGLLSVDYCRMPDGRKSSSNNSAPDRLSIHSFSYLRLELPYRVAWSWPDSHRTRFQICQSFHCAGTRL